MNRRFISHWFMADVNEWNLHVKAKFSWCEKNFRTLTIKIYQIRNKHLPSEEKNVVNIPYPTKFPPISRLPKTPNLMGSQWGSATFAKAWMLMTSLMAPNVSAHWRWLSVVSTWRVCMWENPGSTREILLPWTENLRITTKETVSILHNAEV